MAAWRCRHCGHVDDVHWSEDKAQKYGHFYDYPRPRYICGGNAKTEGFCECAGFRGSYSRYDILAARLTLDQILRRTQA